MNLFLIRNLSSPAVVFTFFVSSAFAVQPLSESDMDNVSAETGQNILNVFGPAAAGLTEDYTPSKQQENGETQHASEVATNVLNDIEQDVLTTDDNSQTDSSNLTFEEAQAAIEAGVKVVGEAFHREGDSTTSEIQYSEKDFHHEAEFLVDGSVIHNRDLQIDLLKLENLRGGYDDNNPSAGNIYLSDWQSRGSTRIQTD